MASLFLLLAACSAPERVAIPGTPLSFEVVALTCGTLRPFKMGTHEVTWNEFNAFFTKTEGVDGETRPTQAVSYFGQVGVPESFQESKKPVTNVRWHSAMAYCGWLSKKTGAYYRLPTEKEWEIAARAGNAAASPGELDDLAWHKGNSQGRTHEGGGKKPNAFGLYDMLGNLWEYCLEFQSGSEFVPVLRGGCWNTPAAQIRFDQRQTIPLAWFEGDGCLPRSVWWLTSKDVSQGFRVVCVADGSDRKDREAYGPKIEVKIAGSREKVLKTESSQAFFAEVTGEIRNGGERILDEVELMIYYLDPKGKPHLADLSGANKAGQATFSRCWPVLANSFHDGRQSFKPGETRKFVIDIPQTFDSDGDEVDDKKFGGRVTNLRFAK
jgi:hypothetical protein